MAKMMQDNPKVYKALREIVANYEQVKQVRSGGGGTGCGGRQTAEKEQKNAKPNLSKVNPPGKHFKGYFPAFDLSAVFTAEAELFISALQVFQSVREHLPPGQSHFH